MPRINLGRAASCISLSIIAVPYSQSQDNRAREKLRLKDKAEPLKAFEGLYSGEVA
jgi:hypothetical protein